PSSCCSRRRRVARSSLSGRGLKLRLSALVLHFQVARSSLSGRGLKHHALTVQRRHYGRPLIVERAWIETLDATQPNPAKLVARSSLSGRGLKQAVAQLAESNPV